MFLIVDLPENVERVKKILKMLIHRLNDKPHYTFIKKTRINTSLTGYPLIISRKTSADKSS